jgi:hypothetical protein
MYGLMSSTGVPSMASSPCIANVNPSTFSRRQRDTPIRLGRFLLVGQRYRLSANPSGREDGGLLFTPWLNPPYA